MSKLDGVIRVHPNGLNEKALVFFKDKKDVDAEKIRAALRQTAELRFRKMEVAKT